MSFKFIFVSERSRTRYVFSLTSNLVTSLIFFLSEKNEIYSYNKLLNKLNFYIHLPPMDKTEFFF
jgi:hypothetical protein